jgi:hypothetical protein
MLRAAIATLRRFGVRRRLMVAGSAISLRWWLRRSRLLCLVGTTLLLRIKAQRLAEQGSASPGQRGPCERRSEYEYVEKPKLRLVQRNSLGLFFCYLDLFHDAYLRRAFVMAGVTALRPCHAMNKCNPDAKALCCVCIELCLTRSLAFQKCRPIRKSLML